MSFDLLASTSTTYYHVTTVSGIYVDFEKNLPTNPDYKQNVTTLCIAFSC